MRTLYSLYRLCVQIFTLLCIQGTQGLEPLDSLRCVNNFRTHWICHWTEMVDIQYMLPMNLYHWNNLGRQRCDPAKTEKVEGGKVHKSCRFDNIFSSVLSDNFAFIPNRDVHAETYIIPSSKVRMLPPKDLKVQISNNGKIKLTWKLPKNIHSSASLLYQVTYYRKDWETWEDAVSLNVLGKMEVTFSPHSFALGSTYLFRVRSMAQEDPAYRSVWSKELSWAIPAGHGAIVQNVNCEYDGSVQMRCSWEVRKELINSVNFTLYYTESPTDDDSNSTVSPNRMKLCLGEKNEIKGNMPYVQYGCSLQIPASKANNLYSIRVRTHEEVKNLKASENIQTEPPTNFKLKDQSNNGYTLEWSPPKVDFGTIHLMYQLCYWKKGEQECPAYSLVNVSGNPPEHYFPVSKLEGSTYYTAKVRAKPDEKFHYNGPWSEWSQHWSWETTIVLTTEVICISAVIVSVAVSLFAFFAFRHCKRFKQRFDDSLPNPSKSKLLSSHSLGFRKQRFNPFIYQDFYVEEEKPSICVSMSPVAPQTICQSAEDLGKEEAPNVTVCLLGPDSSPPPAEEKSMPDQSKCKSLGNTEKCNITTVATSDAMKDLSKKNCNGPYLMFTGAQSMSNLVSNEAKHPGYFSLPRSKADTFNLPKETIQPCQPQPPGDQMGYVINMEKQVPVQPMQSKNKKCTPDNTYFAIPAPSHFQISGPLMTINPDGSGPLLLKQVGDYCFFPGLCGSQENLERKVTPSSEGNQQNAPKDPSLPAVQAFKVMQRGYFALPHA